ncbi:helix-turn-helix domain-containing protein [Gluconacetobacter tumulisoli]|uniref:Helix-turn-helix domain-containing protein n=1 Tax=Gluconacetobacter tumulisoli TaxID=1286189 RepID=A0A7W4PMX1_9PROT|nr:helix-turn-helix domain-containing protein [Gluconacetobacter tumulisoli]MBB2202074.1 helix-turn-helix domain-containing protein [Gluconacetobacter tumulisoli]
MTGDNSVDAVRKAGRLLKMVAVGGTEGFELGTLAELCRLPRSTTHRLLASLVDEGLVARVRGTRRYARSDLHGGSRQAHIDIPLHKREWREAIQRVPLGRNDAIFVLARDRDDVICVDACFGERVIPSLTGGVGGRVALGFGPGATMILSCCDNETISRVTARSAGAGGEHALRRDVETARQRGYACDEGALIRGIGGIAVSIPRRTSGTPLALGVALHIDDRPPRYAALMHDLCQASQTLAGLV